MEVSATLYDRYFRDGRPTFADTFVGLLDLLGTSGSTQAHDSETLLGITHDAVAFAKRESAREEQRNVPRSRAWVRSPHRVVSSGSRIRA